MNTIASFGFGVGLDVGILVGVTVGEKDGAGVGRRVGVDVGNLVGVTVGVRDGANVGRRVGAIVGNGVGGNGTQRPVFWFDATERGRCLAPQAFRTASITVAGLVHRTWMASLTRFGVAANQAFTRQTFATARARQIIGAHWRPDGTVDLPDRWQALIFLTKHQWLVHGESHHHNCREEHCCRGRHFINLKVKVGKFLSLQLYRSHTTQELSVSSTTLRDVADEPRIIIMFVSLPGSSRWLSARWEATPHWHHRIG